MPTKPLSSPYGRIFLVTGTTSGAAAQLLLAPGPAFNRVRLDAFNKSASDADLTVQWHSTLAEEELVMTIPALSGPVSVIPDWTILAGGTVKVYASVANVIGTYIEVTRA